jgi:hypothetical protein
MPYTAMAGPPREKSDTFASYAIVNLLRMHYGIKSEIGPNAQTAAAQCMYTRENRISSDFAVQIIQYAEHL